MDNLTRRLRDRVASLSRTVPAGIGVAARDLTNRGRGTAARVGQALERGPVDDQVLEARVKSDLGRVTRHGGAVEVTASDARVTISGPALRDEADRIERAVRKVRGVRDVENRLEVHDSPVGVAGLQGGARPAEPKPDVLQSNWAPATQMVAILEGAGLALFGIARGGRLRVLLVAGGALISLRGITNIEFRRLLGIGGGRKAFDVQKALEVDAPVEAAFALWRRFDEFPRFMSHVREVSGDPNAVSHWTLAGPVGAPIEFDAVLTRLVPNEVIAWKSVRGEPIRHAGIVRFEPRANGRSRVTVRMTYNPPAGVLAHAVAALFGVDPRQALDDDLVGFKSLLEHGRTTAEGEETRIEAVAPEAAAAAGSAARHGGRQMEREAVRVVRRAWTETNGPG